MEATEAGKEQGKKAGISQKITDAEREYVAKLAAKVNKDDSDRTTWKNKLINAFMQRQGYVRIRNWPWPGAAEYTTPFTDKTIRKMKSMFVLACIGNKKWVVARPKQGVVVDPQVQMAVKKQELVLNELLQDKKQDFAKKLTILIDNLLEKGKFVAKVIAKFNVRPVTRRFYVEDFAKAVVEQQMVAGQLDPNQPIDIKQIIAGFKKQPRETLYPFLENKYGLDRENEADKETMDEIISRFKKGELIIDFSHNEITQRPDIVPIAPERFIVPKGTVGIQNAPRLTHEYFITYHQIELLAKKGVYDSEVVNDLKDRYSSGSTSVSANIDNAKSRVEGTTSLDSSSEMVRIHETPSWWKGRVYVFTYLPDENNRILKKPTVMPYEFPELEETYFPYVDHDWETKDGRYYSSRGVPEMLQTVQAIQDLTLNNMINRDIINNTPMFMVSNNSDINERKIRFVPGQIINTNGETEVKRFETGAAIDISSERINQIVKAWGDEYMGSMDFSFHNAGNPGGAKTATEISASSNNAAMLPQLDSLLLFSKLSTIAAMVFSIFKQRFDRPMYIRGVRISRSDLEVPCDFEWNGSLEQADKQLQAGKALAVIQTLMGLKQASMIVNDEDMYYAVYDWLDNYGCNDPDRYITRPEEMAQAQIVQLQQQAQQLQQGILNGNVAMDSVNEELMKAKEDLVKARERVQLELLEGNIEMKKQMREKKEIEAE